MIKTALWFMTWRCNFRCPYCWEAQRMDKGEFEPEPFPEKEKVIEAWNRLSPQLLDITGGEPFMYPDMFEVLSRLNGNISFAATTNLNFDTTRLVDVVGPKRLHSMTVSYHPTQKMSFETFLGKVLFLKNRGYFLTVNFVTYPEQMWLLPKLAATFKEHGVRFHVDPYSAAGTPFKWTEEEKKFLVNHTGADRRNAYQTDKRPVMCSAGSNRIVVFPDGKAYRCLNDKFGGKESIGNIYEGTVSMNSGKTYCENYGKCAGCDRDHVEVENVARPDSAKEEHV